MTESVGTKNQKIHPHKFTLWVAIASIIMMFAGLTSAYIVKGSMPGWVNVSIPRLFYFSTGVMLLSSLTMQMALKNFRSRERQKYRNMLLLTVALGIVFLVMQVMAFMQLFNSGVKMEGSGAGQFLYITFGLHGLHVLGGVIALVVILLRTFSPKMKNYSAVPVEVVTTYWHFVDFLWLYVFIFFLIRI